MTKFATYLTILILSSSLAFVFVRDELYRSTSHEQMEEKTLHTKPKEPGQSAFGALSEIAVIIEQEKVDWGLVDMDALWEHLKDMNSLMVNVKVEKEELLNGLLMNVTSNADSVRAIDNMIPAHSTFLMAVRPKWNISFGKIKDGYFIRVLSDEDNEIAKIKALGFSGFMVQDNHHAAHHLTIASGKPAHTH